MSEERNVASVVRYSAMDEGLEPDVEGAWVRWADYEALITRFSDAYSIGDGAILKRAMEAESAAREARAEREELRTKMMEWMDTANEVSRKWNAESAYAEQMTKALRVAKCQLGFILDRHEDEQDCDQDADGHRTPNRDMNTVVDCGIAIAEIDRALAKYQAGSAKAAGAPGAESTAAPTNTGNSSCTSQQGEKS